MVCKDCAVPMVTQTEWRKIPALARELHLKIKTLACHRAKSICNNCYQRRKSTRVSRTNEQIRELFDLHDPGDAYTNTERFRVVCAAVGDLKITTLRSAANRGEWGIKQREESAELTWPSITSGGITYWQKPNETRAEFIERVNSRKRNVA